MTAVRRCLCGRAMIERGMAERDADAALVLLADFRLLLYLFIMLRLALAFVYQPYTFDL